MPKKNLLISAALTAFILVIATSIASAYQRVNATLTDIQANPTAIVQQVEPTALPTAIEFVQVALTHQEAALVAANFLQQTDIYSVENIVWEGVDAYKVVFSSGYTAYVSMYGDIIGTEEPPVTVITTTNNNASSNNNNNASNNNNRHEDDDDDDHD